MKKLLLNSILILAYLSIVGCSTLVKNVPIYVTDTKVVTVPPELLTACVPSPPPDKTKYLSSDYMQKESILIDYSMLLLNDIQTCNDKITSIKDINDKQKALYENKDNKTK